MTTGFSPRLRQLATRASLLATLALACLGCGLGAEDNFAPLTVFDNFRTIEDGRAYRSAQLDDDTLAFVFEQYGIRTLINLRGANEDERWYQRERAAAEQAGVRLVDIRMSAHALPARDQLLLLYDTFQTAEYPILMHCQGGADRSGAAAAIWRMVIRGEPRRQARQELSLLYGHFVAVTPQMDRLVGMFEPRRDWIERDYREE